MSNRNRTAGHNWELICRNSFQSLGYPQAVSSRSESRNADNAGIDLCNTGLFQIQCKRTANLPDLSIFKRMKRYAENKWNAIFWSKQKRRNKNMVTEGEYVIMPLQDWFSMVQAINEEGLQ